MDRVFFFSTFHMRLGESRIGNWGPAGIGFKPKPWPSAIYGQGSSLGQPPASESRSSSSQRSPVEEIGMAESQRDDVRSSALEPIIMVINRPGNWLLICSLVTNSGRQRAITRLNYTLKINKTPQRQQESLFSMAMTPAASVFRIILEVFWGMEKVTPL